MEETVEEVLEEKPKRKRNGAYAKRKGNSYELKIIKELMSLGYKGLKSSRSESKALDNDKIDIAETQDKLPCYIQCKCTKVTPSMSQIMKDCPRKDKPLVIIWNKQVSKEVNMASEGEYALLPKDFFYELIKKIN